MSKFYNIKKIINLISKAFLLTLAVYFVLLCMMSIIAAYSVWIQGHFDVKFGEWGSFKLLIMIFSIIITGQCGILFIGNITSTLILNKKKSRSSIITNIAFTIVNISLIFLLLNIELEILTKFLLIYPIICMILMIIGSIIEKVKSKL